jgi:hypothetical protein
MPFGTDLRNLARAFLGAAVCALVATSCTSKPWRTDPNVTSGRWATSPDTGSNAEGLPPRNALSLTPLATRPASSQPTSRPVKQKVRPELTGAVTIGGEGARAGAPGSSAHLDFFCGGGKGTCTVVVEVNTEIGLDNEHLELKLEAIDSGGQPRAGSAPMTRTAGVIVGEATTYQLSVKPCGRVRVSATAVEAQEGKPGVQSRWTVRVLRFRCQ